MFATQTKYIERAVHDIFDVNTKLAAGKFTFLATHSAFRYLDAFSVFTVS